MDHSQSKRRKTSILASSSTEDSTFNESIAEVTYAGRVASIQMVNFMCHSNLEITFNPRMNFIVGRNGSGKSAVMAALVVVLGGKASNTQRGSAVSDFIKKGENSGRVTIVLLNEGINAYRHSEYGDRISITRNFSRTTNSYVVKSEHGEVVSKKKQEVTKICEYLRLEVTNPICVLNQDVARSFLTSSDSKLRYELFMRATQLKQLQAMHNNTVEELTESFSDLERKTALLSTALKDIEEIKKKLHYLRSLEKVAEERKGLENEFLWAGVVAEEDALRAIEEERTLLESKLAEITEGDKNYEERMNELKEELDDLKSKVDEVSKNKPEIMEKKRKAHEQVIRADQQIEQLKCQLDLDLPRIERLMADIKKVREYIEEVEERNSRSAAEYTRVKERIRVVKAELKNFEERFVAAERDMNNAQETKSRIAEKIRSVDSFVMDAKRSRDRKMQDLQGMRGGGDIDALKFGHYVPKLLAAIDDAVARQKFQRRPIGPLGMYVKLNCDSKWAPAVESIVGSNLTSFCCDNHNDFRVLSQIMDQIVGKRQPVVVISKFQNGRHNVSSQRVYAPGFLSIMDALTITDDTVFNTLVDQLCIEGILLFERDEQAATMLTHVENVPNNLRMAVTMACDKYYPAPNYKTYAGRPSCKYFNQSSRREDVIAKHESTIKELGDEIEKNLNEKKKLLAELSKLSDFSDKARERLRELHENRANLKMELSELLDKENSVPVPRTRLALEEELVVFEQQREQCEADREAKLKRIQEIKISCQGTKEELEIGNKKLNSIQNEINEIDAKITKNLEDQNGLKFMKKNSVDQLNKIKEQILANETRKIVAEDDLRHRIQEAKEICPERIETKRSLQELCQLIEKKQQYLKAASKISGSKDETMKEYREKKEAYEKKHNEQNKMRENVAFFTRSVHGRIELLNEKRKLCAREVGYYFQGILKTRGFDGNLRFNYDNEQLELEVHPHVNETGDRRTDAKTLSGGERSYSTVSFILAMWRAVVMPFYFLDEFDVFMDKVNRKVVLDLLISYGSEKTNTQFVFITPQDMSAITASDTISIFRMPDPERNASTD